MKKLFCVFLTLSIILLALPFSVSAASGVTAEIGGTCLQIGERVNLTVTFDAGRQVQAFQYTVEYDPEMLVYVSASGGMANAYESGKVIYTAAGNGTCDTATFVFRAKAEGEVLVNFTGVAAADTEEYFYPDSSFSFTVSKAERGDVDANGSIDASDLALLKLFLAGNLSSVSDFADYNMDLKIDTVDLASLKQYLSEG